MADLSTPIEKIEAFRVSTPLLGPLLVWNRTITTREFVFARVYAGGKVGTGFGLTRGADVDRVIERQIAPLAIGQCSIRAVWEAARASVRMTGEQGIFARALAAVDIALWDLLGHLVDAPLWRLLGGNSAAIPCLAIAGYYRPSDPVESVRRDAEALLKAGYTRFKIPVGVDADLDARRLAAMREVIGESALLAVDAGGVFDSVKDALAYWRRLEPYGVAFLEDPFREGAWEMAIQLAQTTGIKVAFGESIASPGIVQRLGAAGGVDIVRPDATLQMGITGYMQGVAVALENRVPVYPHYFPDIHAPLVGALGGWVVEESPVEADTVGFRVLRAAQPHISDGVWHLGDRPGLGIMWDEDALAALRVT